MENHYSDDAVEKENKNREEHGNWNSRKNAIWLQMIAKKSNWGPRSRLKMKMKAGRMVFPTHYFTLVSEKNEIALILPQKVIQSRFFDFLVFCKIRPWTRSDPGIGRIVAVAVKISPVCSVENHYSNREVDELDEQKVNFKSQPNKEKSYLWILPVGNKGREYHWVVLIAGG